MRFRLGLISALCATALVWGAPAAQAASCPGQDDSINASNIPAAETAMLCLVNDYRTASGLNTLTMDSALASAARAHSEDMVARGYFDHTDPDGNGPAQRAEAAGYPSSFGIGENIAAQGPIATPKSLFTAFQESPAHNANMLDTDWHTAGIGIAVGVAGQSTTSGATVTQMFGGEDRTGGAGSTSGCQDATAAVQKQAGLVREIRRKAQHAHGAKRKRLQRSLKKAQGTLAGLRDVQQTACP